MQGKTNELTLPFAHFYSTFVQILGTENEVQATEHQAKGAENQASGTEKFIFSRIEKHRALKTDADYDLDAEKPAEGSNWDPIKAEINAENYNVKWQIDLAFYEFSL